MSIFETIMLLCFGFAWPISIIKSWKSRTTGGKSPLFSAVILIGYAAGFTHKLLYSNDIVMYLYVLNFVMVAFDLSLWFRNRRIEAKQAMIEEDAAETE